MIISQREKKYSFYFAIGKGSLGKDGVCYVNLFSEHKKVPKRTLIKEIKKENIYRVNNVPKRQLK